MSCHTAWLATCDNFYTLSPFGGMGFQRCCFVAGGHSVSAPRLLVNGCLCVREPSRCVSMRRICPANWWVAHCEACLMSGACPKWRHHYQATFKNVCVRTRVDRPQSRGRLRAVWSRPCLRDQFEKRTQTRHGVGAHFQGTTSLWSLSSRREVSSRHEPAHPMSRRNLSNKTCV